MFFFPKIFGFWGQNHWRSLTWQRGCKRKYRPSITVLWDNAQNEKVRKTYETMRAEYQIIKCKMVTEICF